LTVTAGRRSPPRPAAHFNLCRHILVHYITSIVLRSRGPARGLRQR
jgi:hypothetical protein